MDVSQLKRSMQEIAGTFKTIVEAKLGDRSQLEEQVKVFAKQVEKSVTDAIWGREKVKLKIKKLENFKGELPSYATMGSSGLDARACLDGDVTLKPMERALIPTGLAVAFPRGYELQVRPRSGLAIKQGLSLVNTPGTVDADYRGEIKIIVINLGQEEITIKDQDRIAQMVLCPVIHAELEEVEDLDETDRGAGGFGSTGQ